MKPETIRTSLRLASSVVALAAVLTHRGAEAGELKVCIDQHNPAAKMHAAVARAAAEAAAATEDLQWFDGRGDGDDGVSPRLFEKLVSKQGCQLIMGFPVDAQSASTPEGLHATQAYARTGFVLVSRTPAADSIAQLPQGSAVGVTYMTAPNLFFEHHSNISPQMYEDDAATLQALEHRQVAAAMLWRPFVAAQMQRKAAAGLHYSALAEPHADWNLVALYADAARPEAESFNRAIEQLRSSGRLQALLQPYADLVPETQSVAQIQKRLPAAAPQGWHWVETAAKKSADNAPPPALYTEAQAAAGKTLYQADCAACHAPDLSGRAGPALKGPNFANAKAKFSVGDVFTIISHNMPASAPGTLAKDDYVSIMAYLLSENGYPSGSDALAYDAAGKSKVKLIFRPTTTN